jgi:hypothetical protein
VVCVVYSSATFSGQKYISCSSLCLLQGWLTCRDISIGATVFVSNRFNLRGVILSGSSLSAILEPLADGFCQVAGCPTDAGAKRSRFAKLLWPMKWSAKSGRRVQGCNPRFIVEWGAGLLPESVLHGYALYCKLQRARPPGKLIKTDRYRQLLNIRTWCSEARSNFVATRRRPRRARGRSAPGIIGPSNPSGRAGA